MSTSADVLRWMTIGVSMATRSWLNFVECSVCSAFRTVPNADHFCITGTHQYRFRLVPAFLIVLNATLRPLTYLYRPNFPLRVVNGLP